MTGQEPAGPDLPGRPRRHLIGGAAAACAVCCAPPVLALLGIAGAGATVVAATLVFAGLTFAIVVAGLSALAFLVRRRRGRRTQTCSLPLQESAHGPRPLPDPVRRGGDS